MSAVAHLKPSREKSILKRHPWIFTGAVRTISGKPESGETVDVYANDGQWLARAAYSPKSQIQFRVWTFNFDETVDREFFQRKIFDAIKSREILGYAKPSAGYRVIAAEADGLPGLVVDCYDNCLVCQFQACGVDRWKSTIIETLKHFFPGYSIYERSDVEVRKKEGLVEETGLLAGAEPPIDIVFSEGDTQFYVDVRNGHKTGFYLDQRVNREMVKKFVKDKSVLNCFCYTGGFGVYALAGGAKSVTNVDSSQYALDYAVRNTELNALNLSQCEFIKHDVFKLLREFKNEQRQFDVVILDPPKFADNKSQLDGAIRGYKDINMLAMDILKPGGILFTYSCSGLMSNEFFVRVVAYAAMDLQKDVKVLHRLSQSPDHPYTLAYPEGYYLKGLVCQVT
ncbi:MAG: class I SAM-dependent methyltransferase [Pseudomonadota bacterium]